MTVAVLLIVFTALLTLGVPIAFSIGIATVATMLLSVDMLPALTTVAQRMAGGLDSFALLAIPLFILSGVLIGQGGIARRLIEFAKSIVGMLPRRPGLRQRDFLRAVRGHFRFFRGGQFGHRGLHDAGDGKRGLSAAVQCCADGRGVHHRPVDSAQQHPDRLCRG